MTEEVSPEVLAEAKVMGWKDKPEFKGNPEHWVPADQYVEKGRHVLPIVTAHNQELRGQLQRTNQQVEAVAAALRAANATIDALQESHDKDVQTQVQEAKENLKKELEAASRDGDHAAVADITSKMAELNTAVATPPDKKQQQQQQQQQQLAPEIVAWYAENPEFTKDRRQISLANAIAAELRAAGDTTTGRAFMDKIRDEARKALGLTKEGLPSRTEAGNGGGSRGNSSGAGRTYADLPQDAKDACDKQSKRLVGPNRAHKDEASWRASYTRQYFKE